MLKTFVKLLPLCTALSGLFTLDAQALEIQHAQGSTTFEQRPERVVAIGLGSLDTLDAMGIKPVAVSRISDALPDYLAHYKDNGVASAGSLSEPDFESIYNQRPDLIVVGARAADQYKALSEIAPTIVYATDPKQSYWTSTKQQWRNMAKVFDQTPQVEAKIAELEKRIAAILEINQEHKLDALTVMSAGGNITTFGAQSRFSAIYKDFGFSETVAGIAASRHGDLISYEFIREHDPSTLLVIDKDKLLNNGQSDTLKDFANPLVSATRAYRDERVRFLDINAWYLAIAGMRATEQMIEDIQTLQLPTKQ